MPPKMHRYDITHEVCSTGLVCIFVHTISTNGILHCVCFMFALCLLLFRFVYFLLFQDGTKVLTASSDKTCKVWDLHSNQSVAFAQHTAPVKHVRWVQSPHYQLAITGSWDKTLKVSWKGWAGSVGWEKIKDGVGEKFVYVKVPDFQVS